MLLQNGLQRILKEVVYFGPQSLKYGGIQLLQELDECLS